jgi:hypothetical protein
MGETPKEILTENEKPSKTLGKAWFLSILEGRGERGL